MYKTGYHQVLFFFHPDFENISEDCLRYAKLPFFTVALLKRVLFRGERKKIKVVFRLPWVAEYVLKCLSADKLLPQTGFIQKMREERDSTGCLGLLEAPGLLRLCACACVNLLSDKRLWKWHQRGIRLGSCSTLPMRGFRAELTFPPYLSPLSLLITRFGLLMNDKGFAEEWITSQITCRRDFKTLKTWDKVCFLFPDWCRRRDFTASDFDLHHCWHFCCNLHFNAHIQMSYTHPDYLRRCDSTSEPELWR